MESENRYEQYVDVPEQTLPFDSAAARDIIMQRVGAASINRAVQQTVMDRAMASVQDLAVGFAEAMIKHRMPATIVVENHYSDDDTPEAMHYNPNRRLLSTTQHRAWILARGSGQSSTSGITATIEQETFSRSLLSGSPNNFRTNYTKIDPSEIEEYRYGAGAKLRYQEDAVAVSSLGTLLSVCRFYHGRPLPKPTLFVPYELRRTTIVRPEHFFDRGQSFDADQILPTVLERLQATTMHYADKQKKESSDELAQREFEYYLSTEYPQDELLGLKQPKHFRTKIIRSLRRGLN